MSLVRFSMAATKQLCPELMITVKASIKKKTELQLLTEKYEHKLLYLPPYHPETNPIEYALGHLNRIVAKIGCYDINKICNEVLPIAFSLVTSTIMDKLFAHVRKLEEDYRMTTKTEILSLQTVENGNNKDEIDESHMSDEVSGISESEDELELIEEFEESFN